MNVGPGIRRRRRALELTLAEVARRAEVSVPFLSQVENGRSRPSMSSLQRIADALDSTAVELLASAEAPRPVDVVRAGDTQDGIRPLVRGEQRLHALEFTGNHDWDRVYRHAGDEVMYVADGSIEAEVDDTHLVLERGDTLYCAAERPHRWRPLEEGTRVLLVGIATP